MEAALIAGFFAFFGAVAGQVSNRNTQRETWLLQKRAEVFYKFIEDFDQYDREITRLKTVNNTDERHTDHMLACDKLNASENIVCFYLSEQDKKEFRDLVSQKRDFEYDYSKITDYKDPAQIQVLVAPWLDLSDKIQALFERNLEKISWY